MAWLWPRPPAASASLEVPAPSALAGRVVLAREMPLPADPASTFDSATALPPAGPGRSRPCGFPLLEPTGAVRRVATEKAPCHASAHLLDWKRRPTGGSGRSVVVVVSPVSECRDCSRQRLTFHARLHQSVLHPPRGMRRGIAPFVATFRSPQVTDNAAWPDAGGNAPLFGASSGAHGVQSALRRFAPVAGWPVRFRADRARVPLFRRILDRCFFRLIRRRSVFAVLGFER